MDEWYFIKRFNKNILPTKNSDIIACKKFDVITEIAKLYLMVTTVIQPKIMFI